MKHGKKQPKYEIGESFIYYNERRCIIDIDWPDGLKRPMYNTLPLSMKDAWRKDETVREGYLWLSESDILAAQPEPIRIPVSGGMLVYELTDDEFMPTIWMKLETPEGVVIPLGRTVACNGQKGTIQTVLLDGAEGKVSCQRQWNCADLNINVVKENTL